MPILMPTQNGQAVALSRRRWLKKILPFGTVRYRGRELRFTRDLAERIVRNFKAKATDAVPFTLVNGENRHNDDPERIRGEVKDMATKDDGLYAIIETDPRGTELLSNNPRLGVSARFLPDFKREHDGKEFGPVIEHVAGTPSPHISGLGIWEAVETSRAAVQELWSSPWDRQPVVDLSAVPFERQLEEPGFESFKPSDQNVAQLEARHAGFVDLSDERAREKHSKDYANYLATLGEVAQTPQRDHLTESGHLSPRDAEAVKRERAIAAAGIFEDHARRQAELHGTPPDDHQQAYERYKRQLGIEPGSHRRGELR